MNLSQRVAALEPLAAIQAGAFGESIYGVVDRINDDGTPHFIRRWKGQIGNMVPTDEEPNIYVIEKLEPAILKHKKYKCFFGGRAGTKSIMAVDAMVGDVSSCGSKVYVLRERMKSLKESIYSTVLGRIKDVLASGFVPVPSQWEVRNSNGGKFTFGGMQNIIDMKGSFNYKYFLMEEASKTKQETIDILGPTLRNVDNAELWWIWNPESSNDPMSKEFIIPYQADLDRYGYYEDEYHLIIKVGFEDNVWFMNDASLRTEYEKDLEKKEDGRMSKARFNHIWHGAFNDDVENGLIEPDWFDACIDAHTKLGFEPLGAVVVTHDPADTGADSKGLMVRKGVVFYDGDEIDSENANTAMQVATGFAIKHQADSFGWDADGMGAVLRDQVSMAFNGKNIKPFMFKGSEGVNDPEAIFQGADNYGFFGQKKNEEVIANKRAQNYLDVANRCRKTWEAVTLGKYYAPDELISFSSDLKCIQKLRSELCRLPLKQNAHGKILLYSKAEMKSGITMPNGQKLQLPSPGLADCVMMSFDKSATYVHKTQVVRPRPNRPMRLR